MEKLSERCFVVWTETVHGSWVLGFRCGFLGMLTYGDYQRRDWTEFDIDLDQHRASVQFKALDDDDTIKLIMPLRTILPDPTRIEAH